MPDSPPSTPRSKPALSIVVAVAENEVIGDAGDLPWRLSGDLQRFKKLTMGHALIMGRKTYESIGRPLPGRVTIVLTRQTNYRPQHADILVASTLKHAVELVGASDMAQDEAFVVGGAEIYRLALPSTSRLYRTLVHALPSGDTRFPEVDWQNWRQLETQHHPADAKNQFACTWQVWQRSKA